MNNAPTTPQGSVKRDGSILYHAYIPSVVHSFYTAHLFSVYTQAFAQITFLCCSFRFNCSLLS